MTSLPPLDLDALHAITDGCDELLAIMADAWRGDREATCARMDAALAAHQPEAVAAVAHRLKGSLATLAAARAAATAAAIERAARDGDLHRARALWHTFPSELDDFERALDAHRAP